MSKIDLQARALATDIDKAAIKGATALIKRTNMPIQGKNVALYHNGHHVSLQVSNIDRLMTPTLIHLAADQEQLKRLIDEFGWKQLH